MAVKLDNLHYEFRGIDGYNKPYNFIVSPRELGKTSMFWLKKHYFLWKKDKKPLIYTVRQTVEITEALLDSILDPIINKFTDDNIKFEYATSNFRDGVVDIRIKGELFFRIISLGIKLRRLKSTLVKNVRCAMMDEYIIDPRSQESYLPSEAFKIKEAYTTWARECDGIFKWYFLANPYSLYNPLFVDWKVQVNKLKIGEFYVGSNYVIHYAKLSEELKELILKRNPNYKFDVDYMQYALEGVAKNDKNIKIDSLPPNYSLKYVFSVMNEMIGVYQKNVVDDSGNKYHCMFLDEVSKKRVVYCFDFGDLMERFIILSKDERFKLERFKDALRRRQVSFENINCYYLIEEVYQRI